MEDVLCTGSGLNQEMTLSRPGDTRWNSHYKTLSRLITLYLSIMEVLGCIVETGQTLPCSRQADGLLEDMKKYDFVFYIHLMEHILNITHTLSQCLQRKEQDLMNAVKLVSTTKNQLEKFRLEGFNEFLKNLVLVLPVTTATAERCFSAMKNVKTDLHNGLTMRI
ncbi:uncharacterized protein LOC118488846 [Helianthus annuus]|uniref:uncharacterized protein LOC118488846 n=1 Tax=Helianthus annuus TaxID=4232 RepID=UPI0016531B21|nr:uncharacterized protein LOC118488846 [Helianthus annuus]